MQKKKMQQDDVIAHQTLNDEKNMQKTFCFHCTFSHFVFINTPTSPPQPKVLKMFLHDYDA